MSGIHFFKRLRSAKLVRADLSIDLGAVRREARRRYRLRADFLNRYHGNPRRYWRKALIHEAVQAVGRDARQQRHNVIFPVASKLTRRVTTREEAARLAQLRQRMAGCSITAWGNAEHRDTVAEEARITRAITKRAYDAAIEIIVAKSVALQAAE